jgi:hypothetical protein
MTGSLHGPGRPSSTLVGYDKTRTATICGREMIRCTHKRWLRQAGKRRSTKSIREWGNECKGEGGRTDVRNDDSTNI